MASTAVKREESGQIGLLPRRQSPHFTSRDKGEGCSRSSCPSESDGACRHRQCGSDRMVKTELDAAHALTDLAQLVQLEVESLIHEDKWVKKGRRSRKRLKSEAREKGLGNAPSDTEMVRSIPQPPLHLVQVAPIEDHQQEKRSKYMARRAIMAPLSSELSKPISNFSTRSKSTQNLSEVEKEAKRLRRVLANRESARQTILRRQAFCEELTKKAADLTCDNERMKQEKEFVMKEYQSLKDRNEHLKAQVAKTITGENVIKVEPQIKCEVEETPEVFSIRMEVPSSLTPSSSSMQLPSLVYNRPPLTPFVWPPFYPFHTMPLPQNMIDSKDSASACIANPYHHWANSGFGANWPRIPFYVPPCPWFYPPPYHWPGSCSFHSQTSGERDANEIHQDHEIGLFSKAKGNTKRASLLNKCRDNASGLTEVICTRKNASKVSARTPTDSGSQMSEPCTKYMTPSPTPPRTLRPTFDVKSENVLEVHLDSEEAISSTADCTISSIEKQGTGISSKKLIGVATTTKARKRRKELSKLKSLHTRQLRLPC